MLFFNGNTLMRNIKYSSPGVASVVDLTKVIPKSAFPFVLMREAGSILIYALMTKRTEKNVADNSD